MRWRLIVICLLFLVGEEEGKKCVLFLFFSLCWWLWWLHGHGNDLSLEWKHENNGFDRDIFLPKCAHQDTSKAIPSFSLLSMPTYSVTWGPHVYIHIPLLTWLVSFLNPMYALVAVWRFFFPSIDYVEIRKVPSRLGMWLSLICANVVDTCLPLFYSLHSIWTLYWYHSR